MTDSKESKEDSGPVQKLMHVLIGPEPQKGDGPPSLVAPEGGSGGATLAPPNPGGHKSSTSGHHKESLGVELT